MYKSNLLILVLLFIARTGFGQTVDNTDKKDEKNIYYNALVMYLDYVGEKYGMYPDTLHIEEEAAITKNLLPQCGQTTFNVLGSYEKIQYLRKRKMMNLVRISPLKYENGEFAITIIPFSVSYKRKGRTNHLDYINGGGYIVTYKFEDGRFLFVRIKQYGI